MVSAEALRGGGGASSFLEVLRKMGSDFFKQTPPIKIGSTYIHKKNNNYCDDCGVSSAYHIQTWLEELSEYWLSHIRIPRRLEHVATVILETLFTSLGLMSFRDGFTSKDIQPRSMCFIEELKKRGGLVQVLRGPAGYTSHFRASINEKIIRFEGLPIAQFASKYHSSLADNKEKTKHHLKKGNFPVASGSSFGFWQKKKAMDYGTNIIGFPLVIKPRGGSVSRHVTTNIQNTEQLNKAIDVATAYSPFYILEQFIPDAFVFRATVIDFDFVACVKQVAANVIGDGTSTIRALINKKNADPKRSASHENSSILHTIVEDEKTTKLLSVKGYTVDSIPKQDEIVFLQIDPFLKLGGDLMELTPYIHPDNLRLFRNLARFFDMRVVGIDFLAHDITYPYTQQPCAVLELNSAPCIELHHYPSSGDPQNVAHALVNLFFKYYL
ncbi:MAG: hypothetical protein Q8P11_01985 [bacterium]|nr:hypothetical protein [bacterium]